MLLSRKGQLVSAFVFLSLLASFVSASPGVLFCAIYSSDAREEPLVESAIERIESIYGRPSAKPDIFFPQQADEYWPFSFNSYGSTHFLPWKTCIVIGENGRNIDVVAHEILHAEIANSMGYLDRFISLPIWFDEGLAMQVDYREKYNLEEGLSKDYSTDVFALSTARKFFVSDANQLTEHYSQSKYVVAKWIEKVGADSVFRRLKELGEHNDFGRFWGSEI